MYHYVRLGDPAMPYFPFLHLDDFRRQLDWLGETFGFVRREDFERAFAGGPVPQDGVVLTFDDGFREHYDHVVPELESRGLWGIFYVATASYETRRLLDVHRVHCLLGKLGGEGLRTALMEMIEPHMLAPEHIDAFTDRSYRLQKRDAATKEVKTILNYFIREDAKPVLLDGLMTEFMDEAALAADFYVNTPMLAEMQQRGHVIGSHTRSHPVMSKLSAADQKREIDGSFELLDRAVGGLAIRTFCYPYGFEYSFTADTERLLAEAGCLYSFSVEFRDITADDISRRPQALPRYDCNLFPHGQVSTLAI